MKKEELLRLINEGHEIEFTYKDKDYSISYGVIDGIDVISFCEVYNESKEVSVIDDLLKMQYNDFILQDIIEELDEDSIWIL